MKLICELKVINYSTLLICEGEILSKLFSSENFLSNFLSTFKRQKNYYYFRTII